ncbi:mannose-6-phosphate isomerase, class I [Jeongeupia wiesaeckerbachi]|uniref:mannose-6-phosphate isomerase, class I n=1 Tax=Jeongeupia wiesaeckerbachi TaxID=3051218 RepID=UPI003D800F49
MNSVYRIFGLPQDYQWGGRHFIAGLMYPETKSETVAEWWLGAHEAAPSIIMTAQGPQPLHYAIKRRPRPLLGAAVLDRHGERLPFLLKVLDVDQPLSIQVHPDATQACEGFERENQAGVALDAPHRNYRDPFPKPEMMVALSRFWLLHGFRQPAVIIADLEARPELAPLADALRQTSPGAFFHDVLQWPRARAAALFAPLLERLAAQPCADMSNPDYWLARLGGAHADDPGLMGLYLLNIVSMAPGEAIYQRAGLPHAYLAGRNIEIMANSDNVLRAGLTRKHIDVDEMSRILDDAPIEPNVLQPVARAPGVLGFEHEANDYFQLEQIEPGACQTISCVSRGPEILLVIEGQITLFANDEPCQLGQGESAYIPPGTTYHLWSGQSCVAYRATTSKAI